MHTPLSALAPNVYLHNPCRSRGPLELEECRANYCSAKCLYRTQHNSGAPTAGPVPRDRLHLRVTKAHIPEVEAASRAVAEHHHTHAVGHVLTRDALKPTQRQGGEHSQTHTHSTHKHTQQQKVCQRGQQAQYGGLTKNDHKEPVMSPNLASHALLALPDSDSWHCDQDATIAHTAPYVTCELWK